LFYIDTAGYVKVWHYPTQQCVFTFDEKDRQPLALDFNSNYARLFVAGIINHLKKLQIPSFYSFLGSDCAINCYDFTTKKLIRKLQAS
jgi:WD40 repeat protein